MADRTPAPWLTARAPLILLGVALLAWSIALAEGPGANLPRYVALTLAAGGAYVVALRLVLGMEPSLLTGEGGGRRSSAGLDRYRRLDLALIFLVACSIRVPLLLTPPSLSDDVYRAVWDARLLHAGENPYSYSPGAAEVEAYRDSAIWPRVNHKDQRTPYPPLAELLGAAAYGLLPERLMAMQLLAASMDVLGAALLAWLLAKCGQDPRRCLAVAWSPMGAVHFAHSAHNDASMVAAMVAAALLLTFGRRWLALAALGAATAVKGVPALMLPAFARASGPLPLLAWATAGALATIPFFHAGPGLVAGVLEEAGGQRFNESVHLLIERAAQPALGERAGALATGVALVVVLIVAAAGGLRSDPRPAGALVRGSWALGAYLLVAAVVEPWYFTWLAPLIALRLEAGRGRWPFAWNDAPAWLWLSVTATLTEVTYVPGAASLWVPIRLAEYGPAFALLGVAGLRGLRRRT
jgi:hypothetical protein